LERGTVRELSKEGRSGAIPEPIVKGWMVEECRKSAKIR